MKTGYKIAIAGLIVVGAIVYSTQDNQSPEEYKKEIIRDREARDIYMRSNRESPFVMAAQPFLGLKYFDPDPAFRVNARIIPIENKKVVQLGASDNKPAQYLENAFVEFDLAGQPNKLLLLEIIDPGPTRGTLFLAFSDKTSAGETYGAGRYLDIKKVPAATSIVLDFNKAYNPYCAYVDSYSCPFPPPQNTLKIAVRAGEKSYEAEK